MGNPALEEFFGTRDTVTRLGNALQQASTGRRRCEAPWTPGSPHAAQLANQMSSAMLTLAGQLRSARSRRYPSV